MKKKSILIYVLIFASFCLLAFYFPKTGIDITWSLKDKTNLSFILNATDTALLTNILMSLQTKTYLLNIIIYGVMGVLMFTLMGNLIEKKNHILPLIAFFLFFLLDRLTIANTLTQTHSFTTHIVGCTALILFIRLLVKNTLSNANYLGLFALGLIFSNLEPSYAFTIFALTIIYLTKREDKKDNRCVALLLGEITGLLCAVFHLRFTYTGFTSNLIHEFIPTICNSNFIIVLIFSTLVMIEAVKLFLKGKTISSVLSIFGMSSFLFSSLLSTDDYLNYVTYILFSVSSLYILLNVTSTRMFKRKIATYYLTSFIFMLSISIFGHITVGSVLFFFIVDILIILELYNYIFPTDFLSPLWFVVIPIISGVNIYIYHSASLKYDEMNFYIKNKLECTTEDIVLPSKYKTDFLIDYIPLGREHIAEYIEYYDINLYDKEKHYVFKFRQ